MSRRLAITGGQKAATNKPQGWPQSDEKAIKAAEAVLRSGKVNYWTGKCGMEFEKHFIEWQGSNYAVSLATGTAALHVALNALGIGPSDEVIVPSYTFIASSFSVVQAGAIPRSADVNLDDQCIGVESAEGLVTPRTKANMPVHRYGNVCDMAKIKRFAKRHKLFVIEDNAEAFGGSYNGKKTGTLGQIAGCSFCQNKTFTTGGEGGMVTTDDEDLAWKARSFRDHSNDVKQRLSPLELEQRLPYIHTIVGSNYRMTEMQSAIGLAELARMETWNMPRRTRNARILIDAPKASRLTKDSPIDTPERQNGWYVLAFSRDVEKVRCDIKEFVSAVSAEGAPVWKVFWPQCHTERAVQEHNAFGRTGFPFKSKEYADAGSVNYENAEVPNARWHEAHTFTCVAFPTFTESDIEQIANAILEVVQTYST